MSPIPFLGPGTRAPLQYKCGALDLSSFSLWQLPSVLEAERCVSYTAVNSADPSCTSSGDDAAGLGAAVTISGGERHANREREGEKREKSDILIIE